MTLVDYNDISFESKTIMMEIEGLSDDALMDECCHILTGLADFDDLDDIMGLYFREGNLKFENRKRAEYIYLLAYSDLGWDV